MGFFRSRRRRRPLHFPDFARITYLSWAAGPTRGPRPDDGGGISRSKGHRPFAATREEAVSKSILRVVFSS